MRKISLQAFSAILPVRRSVIFFHCFLNSALWSLFPNNSVAEIILWVKNDCLCYLNMLNRNNSSNGAVQWTVCQLNMCFQA